MVNINSKLSEIPKIGPKYTAVLKKLNIETVEDFLLHFPFRYEDYSQRVSINNLSAGTVATVMGEVVKSKLIRTWKKKMLITECFIKDETGIVRAVWFNQPYVSDLLVEGKGVRLSGKVSEDSKGLFFSNPAWELSSRVPTNTGRLVPVYPETEGLTSKWIRWQMQNLIKYADELKDPVPEKILKDLHLPNLKDAINCAHFPKTLKQSVLAQKRIAFDQMFLAQLASQSVKISWNKKQAVPITFDEKLIKKFVDSLPFSLTNAQRKSAFQILKDIEKPVPMNRLLNGDVGSGKTVVAAMAILNVIKAGYQVAFMAPTEILAQQHYESILKLFAPYKMNIALLTNSYQQVSNLKLKDNAASIKLKRPELLEKIATGNIDIVVGTHALIQKDIKFKNLASVIIDEQHRFGVDQRAYLQQKIAEINDGLPEKTPHLLSMSATPIPRTLALAFFGNLNLSVLDEMPKNRKPIKTEIIGARDRQKIYDFVRQEIKNGRQAFIIFPLVEESQKMSELKAATEEHERLSKNIFPDLKLALLHGKMKAKEKEKIMQSFKEKKYDILVSTSVVEVGIDIPNATIMIIEDADRFGLSQLHQFRGRVGRSDMQSYCFLFTGSTTVKATDRLKALEKYSSGFDIAQKDFELRGPGEFFGTRQSGLPDVAMQNVTNVKLIEISQSYAEKTLKESPDLKKFPLLKKELEKFNQNVHLE
jgi:ATP-dependent DNA helicase RecG